MGFVYKLFQITLLIFNVFYFLIGLASILSVIAFNVNSNALHELIKELYSIKYKKFIFCLIFYGFTLLTTGLLACYGILRKSKSLLIIYFILLFLIFVFQFISCLIVYLDSNDFINDFLTELNRLMITEYKKNANAINYIQQNFKCCGIKSPSDWLQSNYVNPTYYQSNKLGKIEPYRIPQSCCDNEFEFNCVLMNKYHEVGCETRIKFYFKGIESYFIWALSFMTILQLILLLLTLYLVCLSLINNKRNIKIKQKIQLTPSMSSMSSVTNNDDSISIPEIQNENYQKWNNFYNNNNESKETAILRGPPRISTIRPVVASTNYL